MCISLLNRFATGVDSITIKLLGFILRTATTTYPRAFKTVSCTHTKAQPLGRAYFYWISQCLAKPSI
jgi:hypothetical protein